MDTLLPLGTVVRLKGNEELMIISRGALTKQNNEIVYFEYASIIVPYGYQYPDQLYFFNYEDIHEIISLGYQNDLEKDYRLKLADKINELEFKKGSTDD